MLQREPIRPAPAPPPSSRAEPRPASAGGDGSLGPLGPLGPIVALLSRARRRHARIRSAAAAALALGGFFLALTPILALGAAGQPAARWLLALAGAASAAGFLVLGPWRARREVGDLADTAKLLATRLSTTELQRGLLPAYELGRALDDGEPVDFSRPLALAHLEATARQTVFADLASAVPDRPLRLALRGLAACALLLLAAAILWGETLARGARFVFLAPAGEKARAPAAEPVTGEVELTYVYPAYTRLAEKTVPSTNGEISAPRGTEVRLKTRADRDLAKAFAVVGDATLPLEVKGRDLLGKLLVQKPGSYRFHFLDARGKVLVEGPPIPIAAEEDRAPSATLLAPALDVEVDPKAQVKVRFEAADDYGLSEVALVMKLPGATKPQRVVLQRAPDAPRRASGEYLWDLVGLSLMAGDKVAYYLEATDNDEVSGKKAGVSKTQVLRVFSEAEHHRQVIRQVQEKWERLVALLGDRLEAPEHKPAGRTAEAAQSQGDVDARAVDLARELTELARALRKEKAPDPLWRALVNVSSGLTEKAGATSRARSALGLWLKRGVGMDGEPARRLFAALDQEIAEEEKGVLYLESLLDQQRLQDLLALSKELAAKRRDLAGLIEQYQKAPDAEAKERILGEVARLKERMAELLQRMAELSRNIQDEHVNSEALREMAESKDMMGSFDKVQDLLNKGKVQEAMKEMEKLGQMLDDLQKNLQKASQDFKGGEFGEAGRELGDFARGLDELQGEQQGLLQETQKLRGDQRKELERRLNQKGREFVDKLRKKVAEAQARLGEVEEERNLFHEADLKAAQEAADDLDKALAVKDFDQAAQSVAKALGHAQSLSEDLGRQAADARLYPSAFQPDTSQLQKNAKSARGAIPPLDEVSKELASLFPPPGSAMSEEDKQKMRSLAQRQRGLQQKAGSLEQQMQRLNQKAPLFSPEAQALMQKSGERMGRAQGQLQGVNPSGAMAEERDALDQLGQLKKGLERQGQGQGQGGGQSVPWPWMGPGESGGTDDGSGADSSADRDVKIPGADQYQVPEEYRKAILDAMKQGAPDKYRDQVKRYYEEIVK